jgi:hypothetical protein
MRPALELLRELRGQGQPCRPPRRATPQTLPALDLQSAVITESREQIGAVLLRSPRYGEVWVVLEGSLLGELRAEEQERPDPRPVRTTDQVLRLRGKSEAATRAVLNTLAVFPEAEIQA